ncbi:hypothetical protein L226DRAFT_526993 [Lentinus tigrinus ALCF2SS1-7]|uniref:DUF6533 domain-containing protein n=1 Tax=Lentinus tigrinus ALCF2SS1-6 TaxID=1328759 RepID=A0A5C2RQD4_9APHY|nr:hypothetical protein L227DRAFT_567677 [Lentinus tigrinus ALCF2SS1-6]RPD68808.1 hypothetical protein L226DRAFT_526993 [Lentinus tigrinus ALCF2SS1-7]
MSVDISQYIAAYETYRLDMSMFFSVAALVAYEHVITFQQEVDLYWKRKFKISTAVFLANRYLGLIFFGFLEYIPLRPELIYLFSCSATYYSAALANGLIYLPWAVFSALRGYALSQNIWLGFTIFVLSAFPFGTDCYANFQGLTIYVDPTYGCIPNVTISDTYVKYANLFTRVPLVIADLIVVTITWAATYKASKEASVFGSQPSITKILFRDVILDYLDPEADMTSGTGNVYFIILSLVNILHLIFSIVSIGRTDTTIHQSTLVIWIPAFTTILVSRFMLDLQAVTQNQAHQQSLSSFGSVYFNHFVGSLGASLPAPGEGAQMDEQGQPPDECSIED